VPELLNDFESLFWQQRFVAAHAKASRAVAALSGREHQYPDYWIDGSLKLSRVLMHMAAFDEAIEHLRGVLKLELLAGTPSDHMRVVEPSIELALHLLEKGSYVEAEAIMTGLQASKLTDSLDGEHPVVCRMLYTEATMLVIQGWLDEAVGKLRAAEAGQKARLIAGDSTYMHLFDTQVRLVEALYAKFERQSAQQASSALQRQLDTLLGTNSLHAVVLKFLNGRQLLEQANYKAADTMMREVTKTVAACLGRSRAARHPILLSATAKIGEIAQQQARYADAEHIFQGVIKSLAETDLDLEHSVYVAQIQQAYSKLQHPLGRPVEAMRLLTRALDAQRQVPGLSRNALLPSYVLIAQQEVELGQLTQARLSLQNLGAIEQSTALATSQQADVKMVEAMVALQQMEDLGHAEGCTRAALATRQELLPADHPVLALHKMALATILLEQHRIDETQAILREVTGVLSHIFGKASAHMANVKRLEAAVLLQRGLYADAEVLVKDALANDGSASYCEELVRTGYQKRLPDELKRPAVLEDLALLAYINHGLGRLAIAQSLLQELRAVASDIYGSIEHPLLARTLVLLAQMRVYSGQYVEAHHLLQQGRRQQQAILGRQHPHVLLSQLQLVEMLVLLGDADAAIQESAELRKTLLAAASPNLLMVRCHPLPRRACLLAASTSAPVHRRRCGVRRSRACEQVQLVEAHMARLHFDMGQTLRPRAALTRSFVALDQAVLMVHHVGASGAAPCSAPCSSPCSSPLATRDAALALRCPLPLPGSLLYREECWGLCGERPSFCLGPFWKGGAAGKRHGALTLVRVARQAASAAAGGARKGGKAPDADKPKGAGSKAQAAGAPRAAEQEGAAGKDMAMARSLSSKLLEAYTHSLMLLAAAHLHEFENHQAVLLLRIAIENYRNMGILGNQGQGAGWTMLGKVAMNRGRVIEARGAFQRAQKLKTQVRGLVGGGGRTRHPEVLEDVEACAQMCMWLAQYKRAKNLLIEALELTDNELAGRNSRRSRTLVVLADYMMQVGRYGEAHKVLADAARPLASFSERSPLKYQTLLQQAALDSEIGFLPQARALLDAVDDLGVIPRKHPDRAVLVWHKARLALRLYDLRLARELLDDAQLELAKSGLGSDAKRGVDRQASLALACHHVANKHRGRPMIVKFLKTIVPVSWKLLDRQNALHPLRLRFSALDAALLVQEGKLAQARALIEDLVERYRELGDGSAAADKVSAAGAGGETHPLIASCTSCLAQVAYIQGGFAQALALFAEARGSKAGEWLETHVSIAHDCHGMGLCALALAHYDDARRHLGQAKRTLLAASSQAHTMASVAVDVSLALLALETGTLCPDPLHAPTLVDQMQKCEQLRRLWFFYVFLEEDAVARDRALSKAAAQCEVVTFAPGDVVAQPDETTPFMLIVTSGSLDVLRQTSRTHDQGGEAGDVRGVEDGWQRLAILRPGDTFGERCLFVGSPFDVVLRGRIHEEPQAAAVAGGPAPTAEEQDSQGRRGGGQGEALLVPRHALRLLFDADAGAMEVLAPLLARAWRGSERSLLDSTTAAALSKMEAARGGASPLPAAPEARHDSADAVLKGMREVFGSAQAFGTHDERGHADVLSRVPSDPQLDHRPSAPAAPPPHSSFSRAPSSSALALAPGSGGGDGDGGVDGRQLQDGYLSQAAADNLVHTCARLASLRAPILVPLARQAPPDAPLGDVPAGSAAAVDDTDWARCQLVVQTVQVAGQVSLAKGCWSRAHQLLGQAYRLSRHLPHGSCYFSFGTLVEQYSAAMVASGQAVPALAMVEQSVKQVEQLEGSRHWQLLPLCLAAASALIWLGRAREAQSWARRAEDAAAKTYPWSHPRTAQAQSIRAQVMMLQGKYRLAAKQIAKCIDIKCTSGWKSTHTTIASDRYALAQCQAALGLYDQAHKQAQLATDIWLEHAGGSEQRAEAHLLGLAMGAYIKMLQGHYDAASELAHKILRHALCSPPADTLAHASPGPHHPEGKVHSCSLSSRIAAHLVLTQVCKVQGRPAQALEHAAAARNLVLDRYHPSHPRAIEAQLQWARSVVCAHAALAL